jgi:hypothetical protein
MGQIKEYLNCHPQFDHIHSLGKCHPGLNEFVYTHRCKQSRDLVVSSC